MSEIGSDGVSPANIQSVMNQLDQAAGVTPQTTQKVFSTLSSGVQQLPEAASQMVRQLAPAVSQLTMAALAGQPFIGVAQHAPFPSNLQVEKQPSELNQLSTSLHQAAQRVVSQFKDSPILQEPSVQKFAEMYRLLKDLNVMSDELVLRQAGFINQPVGARPVQPGFIPPRTRNEQLVTQIFSQVLGRSMNQISVHDDFLKLGGHSLKAHELISMVNNTFNVNMSLDHFWRAPTVGGLAAHLDQMLR